MTITPEQHTYARLAGTLILVKYVLEGFGDYVTIMARTGETFADTARHAAENDVLWRAALLSVQGAWITIGIGALALYAVLEPVNKRLAQLALFFRVGTCFVGAASLMFRFAEAWLYKASATADLFTTEQLRTLVAVSRRGAGAGVTTSWMLLGTSSMLFFLLFLRSGYLPGALARFGVISGPLLVVAAAVMFVYPQTINWLKLLGLPNLFAEVAAAVWLLAKGLQPRAPAQAWI